MDTKTLCLGVLNRGSASGYEIKKAFEEGPFSQFQETSFGSVYPALTRLAAAGLVECTEMAQAKRPDKKVYSITESGRRALLQALMLPPGPDSFRSDLLFILSFAHPLPTPRLAEIIDRRIALYRDWIARMESCDLSARQPGEVFVHGMGLAFYRVAADYLSAHRDDLLDAVSAKSRLVAE